MKPSNQSFWIIYLFILKKGLRFNKSTIVQPKNKSFLQCIAFYRNERAELKKPIQILFCDKLFCGKVLH